MPTAASVRPATMMAPVTDAELPPDARIATTAPTNDAEVPRYDGILLATTSRNRMVQTPDIMMARFGSRPMINGKTNVAPNMATTCWAPTPIVLGQDSRSSGRTTAPSGSGLPSPTSFHPIAIIHALSAPGSGAAVALLRAACARPSTAGRYAREGSRWVNTRVRPVNNSALDGLGVSDRGAQGPSSAAKRLDAPH